MPIDIDITHVSRLARIELSVAQTEMYQNQLVEILEFASRVQSVDTEGIEPTGHPLRLQNVYREDQTQAPLSREKMLASAPVTEDGYFVVPPPLTSS